MKRRHQVVLIDKGSAARFLGLNSQVPELKLMEHMVISGGKAVHTVLKFWNA